MVTIEIIVQVKNYSSSLIYFFYFKKQMSPIIAVAAFLSLLKTINFPSDAPYADRPM